MNFCLNAKIEICSDKFQNVLKFYWLRDQNTDSIFVPLDGIHSELQSTIYRIC